MASYVYFLTDPLGPKGICIDEELNLQDCDPFPGTIQIYKGNT